MLSKNDKKTLEKIKSREMRDIYISYVRFSKKLKYFNDVKMNISTKYAFRFKHNNNNYFTFLVNKNDFLFYFNKLSLDTYGYKNIQKYLKSNKITLEINKSKKMVISLRISNTQTAFFIMRIIKHFDDYKKGLFPSPLRMEPSLEEKLYPEELTDEGYFDGAIKLIKVNKYERSRKARKACIKFFGNICLVCGMNFEEKYGKIGKNFIHIHHLFPVSSVGKSYRINPQKDLVPVCPNCHAMLHRKDPPYLLDELKAKINKQLTI